MRLFAAAALVLSFLAFTQAPAYAGCEAGASLLRAEADCVEYEHVRDLYATAASDGYTYDVETRCKARSGCPRGERICHEDGKVGTWYALFRTTIATGVKTTLGIVCLTPAEESSLRVITPAMVRREMRRLSWPTAELQIQPPDGQTLINFDTNFFTRNHRPITQTITLLGQQVTIEARPVEYTWHFGDGTADTTTSPGSPYPDLDVTHAYVDTGQVQPSVDTTYRGRYRINDDSWQPVPGSLTVAGDAVDLRIRSATPHLIGSELTN